MPHQLRSQFEAYVGQTSPFPNGLEVSHGSGCRLFDTGGKSYLDFISGIAVVNVGHCHPRVVNAVQEQVGKYAHTMVYGEHVQRPQVELAAAIAEVAPAGLDSVFFLTTGSEANDAALKLAVKLTGRKGIISFKQAYHGDTVGALSCFGSARFREPFTALLFDTRFLDFGSFDDLQQINDETAAVVVEPVQGEAGIYPPPAGWLEALRQRCSAVGALLIFDEVQTGFGRVGDWFAAGLYGVTPDVITLAKGMGMGLPLAGILSRRDTLFEFAAAPPFSHITTFGGHPVSCAAGLAGMQVIREEKLLENTIRCGALIQSQLRQLQLQHPARLKAVRGVGLMVGLETESTDLARKLVVRCKELGLILETTLLDERVIRWSPPLIVTETECYEAIGLFAQALN